MAIGTNIKKIREDKNISFNEMVRKLKVFEKYYSLIEKNLQIPNPNLLRKIAKALGVSSDDIINYNEQKSVVEKTRLDLKNLKYKEINIRTLPVEPIKIGEITYIPIKKPTVREIIFQKPQLLNRDDIFKFGNNIKLVGVKDILPDTITDIVNPFEGLITDEEKPSSPKILNYVEPYKYRGTFKTLFYTEVNSGLKEGDRVFIINGNYDSNKLIEENKYRRQRDGYKVIFVDNCRIVLDIDYTGILPYKELPNDDFINLYVIKNESDFKYFNRQVTTRGGVFDYKFNTFQNTIVYADNNYSPMFGWGENGGLFGAPGFFVRNGTQSWINITSNFILGSFSVAENLSYNANSEVKVINGGFTYSIGNKIVEFKENKIYRWNNEIDIPTWEVNNDYNESFLTKSNFRDGNFKGEWNSGVFGTQNKKIKWEGSPAIWNLGTLLNIEWLSGSMNSLYTLPVSYISEFENGTPYQKLNAPNNNNWGYNYIIDSEIKSGAIENGNIENTIFGQSSTFSTIENYLTGTQSNYQFEINKGLIKNSQLFSGFIKESDVVNSISSNSRFENIKSINSSYKKSLIKDSKYISDEGIKILAYEELSLNLDSSFARLTHKVYRFYISKGDYKKLKIRENFYIKGLRINDDSKYPLDFFNKRFKLTTWVEYLDYYASVLNLGEYFYKIGTEMAAFVSTPKDNEWLYNTYTSDNITFTTEVIQPNNISVSEYYSVDIFVSIRDLQNSLLIRQGVNVPNSEISNYGLLINNDILVATPSNIVLTNKIRDAIDISEAFILNSDFESGLIETTDWISGNNINYNNDVNMWNGSLEGGIYDITPYTSSSTLEINTQAKWFLNSFEVGDDCLDQGNIVFLNNVTYTSNNGTEIALGDTYKIINNDYKTTGSLTLQEIGTNIISNLPDTNGTFSTPGANNRYNYIHKSKIDSSKIKSGIFRRSYITNSLIENDDYNVSDRTFNNLPLIKSLVISDSIFKNTGNILSKATYLHTSFVNGNDQFRQGIVYRSLWNGLTFSDGVFRESTWFDGTFESGDFYNNRSFNSIPNSTYKTYDTDRIKTYYKGGITTATISNNRFSWRSGSFINGNFIKSDWESGNFENGDFNYSNFYSGDINGGFIGIENVSTQDTKIYSAEINYTTVLNAKLVASDPNYDGLSASVINWYDGIFNDGIFGSDISQTASNSAIWHDGEFNGGEFANMAKWKNGSFNNGKFTSGYGWTMSDSATQSDYSWESGVFNNGIFGNSDIGTNSTWYVGEFNGGKFQGRVWNNGVFSYGQFLGSSTYSAIGGASSSNASLFTDSFSQSYYGLWRDGIVTSKKDKFIKDKKFFTKLRRFNYVEPKKKAEMSNFLWLSGTFSHGSGIIYNSVWLDGIFEKGQFVNSSFNPFVKRNGSTQSSFNFSDDCYWKNGTLVNSDFYISKWEYGKFNLGNGYGMIWKDGICNYMNAYNIFWEKGLWRNGNWYGSSFEYDGKIDDGFTNQLLLRGTQWRIEESLPGSSSSCHVWSIFEDRESESSLITNSTASAISAPSLPSSNIIINTGSLGP